MAPFSRRAALALLGCAVSGHAAAPSFSSCGGSGDIMQNLVISLSPDPIQKGRAFTVTASGTLSAPLDSATARADLDAKVEVLGSTLLDKKVQKSAPFTLAPAIPAGPTQLVIGPVTVPGEIPGAADITGKVTLATAAGAQIACINIDFHMALMGEAAWDEEVLGGIVPESAKSCTAPDDHLRNLHASASGGLIEVGGTLDEDVSTMTFEADLSVHVGLFPVPLKIAVPVSYTPGLKKGDLDLKAGPVQDHSEGEDSVANPPQVTGKVLWKDGANQEIACLELDRSSTPQAGLLDPVVV